MEDAPYRAEYAKSSRAGCKLCKGSITKDSLRVAKMVQSPFFDGKQPNWFHFSCFFKQCQPHSTAEVSGFGGLRPADQDRLRAKIQGVDAPDSGATSSGGKGGAKKKGRQTIRSDLQVEYAKSSRSTCKGCHSTIEKGEVRVAKLEQADPSEHGQYAGPVPKWHHVACFLDRWAELDAEGVAADELSGFSKLKKEDQQELRGKFGGSTEKKAGKKRAAEQKGPPPKRSKQEEEKEQQLREQGEMVWKIRDQLQAVLSTAELKQLLEANRQTVPSGESNILDSCADGMVFGALQPCPECGGQLRLRSYDYQCTGNLSSWTKCTHHTTEPDRKAWAVPSDLKEEGDFLKKYKYKPRKRLFEEPAPLPSSSGGDEPTAKRTKVDAPLQGFTVFVIGRLSKTKPQLTQQVEEMGGKVVAKLSDSTTICLSNKSEVEKMSKKMGEVKELEVPVVGEGFLEDAGKGGALLKIPGHTISPWGAPRHSLSTATEDTDSASAFKSTGPQKMKLTVKGSSAVDPESGLEDTHHVLEEGGMVYNAVLGLVDIVRGTNSYYKLQLLEGDSVKSYYVFRSWGRVGTTIGGTKLESHGGSRKSAEREFLGVFLDKTGNHWVDKDKFVKKPNKFYPLEIDYGAEQEAASVLSMREVGSCSKLHSSVQDLVRMIFDVESMKKAMMEFEIDMKKMPLGKLSKRQIMSAYSVLTELQQEVSGAASPARVLDASNRFYTLIPHDFGLKKPPLLDSEEIIKSKTQMLDNLLDIEVAYSLLKDEKKGDPIDVNYEKLKTDMEVLPQDGEEFKMLVEYVTNTHGVTHSSYSLEVLEIFRVSRHGENKRYKPFSKLANRMLLWHGSRTTNYAGILSQGLRIAPPEAPVTGYMFGKGVYFADMVSKSANYCRTSPSDPTGLMLLCEVALGDMYELTHAKYITDLPSGKHSTKGVGRTAPDAAGQVVTPDGVIIPKGLGRATSATTTSLLYNEYIVYDVAQISMKYLLKMNFQYRW